MELPGHVGVALLVCTPVVFHEIRRDRFRRAWIGLTIVISLSMVPDVDLYLSSVAHRGVTHTVWAALLTGGIVAIVASLLGRWGGRRSMAGGRFGAIVGTLAVASHLLGDVITPMGIRPFLPLSDRTVTLSVVYASDPVANRVLLVTGIVVLGIAISFARKGSRAPAPQPDADRGPVAETDNGSRA